MIFNKYQTQLTDEKLEALHPYVKEELLDAIERIELVAKMISPTRAKAKDLPRWDKPYSKKRKEDPNGRIAADYTNPHILEDMDYFRPAAIHFMEHGRYTTAYPSKHPNSEYQKFWKEEERRCLEGYVRPSDGEWVTGYNYYYWNYSPIMLAIAREVEEVPDEIVDFEGVTADRVEGFPFVWDWDYFYYHYLEEAELSGKYGAVLKTRGRGYSFKGGSLLGRNYNFIKKSKSWALASDKGDLIDDGLLTKAWDNLDFINEHTAWRKRRQEKNTMMHKRASYLDLNRQIYKGYKSEIIGLTTQNKPEKARGKRGKVIMLEEAGRYLDLLKVWGIARPSMEQGSLVYGLMVAFGTGGCLTAGNKVWDNKGNLINIEDVTKQTGIIGFKNGFNKETVTWLQPPSNKECVKITTNTGRSLECSTDHPIYKAIQPYGTNITSNEFVEAVSLNVGDLIGVIEKVDIWSNNELNHARSIGMVIGDGTYGQNQSTKFANADKELFDYLETFFELKELRSHITKDNRIYKEVRIKGFNKYLRNSGIYGQTKTNKRLPDNIHGYSKNSVCELIGGLFDTDGYVSIRDNKSRPGKKICEVSIAQSSLELIKELQLLLQKLGIHSNIRTRQPRKNNIDKNPWYELAIRDGKSLQMFSENIKLLVSKKQEKLNQISKYVKTINFNGSSHNGLRYERVVSVENTGVKPVYNLTAGDSNTYIGNGIITHNTEGAAFEGLETLFYQGGGYRVHMKKNVFDKTRGEGECAFYCGEYLNREGFYDKDGNSDVIGALIELFYARLEVLKSTTDPRAIVQEKADRSITPQEAVMRTEGTIFPIGDLKDHLAEIKPNILKFTAAHHVGRLALNEHGVEFVYDKSENVIREFPANTKKDKSGAVEVFVMPQKNGKNEIPHLRYIIGVDPYDDDSGTSLGSAFVFDLWTDKIVAEYTGRPKFANDFYENVRRLAIFYNASINYENKNKGLFGYFSNKHSLHLLADNPKFLKDTDTTQARESYGNKAKGTNPTKEVNALARRLQRDWMLTTAYNEDTILNLNKIRSIAYIQELISWNPDGNFDRVSAMGMVMILREERLKYVPGEQSKKGVSQLANDSYWNDNY